MTQTNRAFIKAYRTDEAQTSPASPTIGGAARPQVPAASAPVVHSSVATSASVERSALYGPRPTAPRTGNATANEKRPLSSFIASTGIARLNSEPAEGDFFRPGTTLASFHWPEVCRTLSRHCGEQLGRVVDLLVTHAAAGRSLVGVLSLTPGRGATTTALCLAAQLAERRRRVVLVDGNFRNPRLANWLKVEPTAGWQDVLKHGAPLTNAVVRATDDRLDLLALGEKIPKDSLRLVSGLQAVVTAGVLRHAYDHVLLDAGAFLDSASQPIALELIRNMGIDAAIAVTGPGSADPREVTALADQLARSGCEFLGTIENRVAKPQAA
ncbi:MAG: hypothetical protein L0228_00175 [Planctomycetes bacterium]|nr:hypothetical protein [Planctomycetota bacterium]